MYSDFLHPTVNPQASENRPEPRHPLGVDDTYHVILQLPIANSATREDGERNSFTRHSSSGINTLVEDLMGGSHLRLDYKKLT